MSEWKPIESAPKDGTIVVLYCPQGIDRLYVSPSAASSFTIGFYGDAGGYHSRDGWHSVESREEIWGYGGELTGPMSETECLAAHPTHWMPLPSPPKEEQGDCVLYKPTAENRRNAWVALTD